MRSIMFAGLALCLLLPAVAQQDTSARLRWFEEARFGMFVHWGIYSILGRGEWVMHNEKIPVAEYEKLQAQFNPTEFDAEEWVALAKAAGMKYLTITSKHHDGFCMFDSKLTNYTSMHAPAKRDLIGELTRACQKAGIKISYYYSLLDWHHPDYKTDLPKYVEYAKGQLRELCANYGKIDGIWFDGGWEHSAEEWHSKELCEMIRQLQPGILINNRSRYDGDFVTPEQHVPGGQRRPGESPFEVCMTINGSWGYNAGDNRWKSKEQLVQMIADIAHKGGNLLLNVGPMPNGKIQDQAIDRLLWIGDWMRVNGESIYGTEAGPFRTLPFGRCTRKGSTLYVHVFDWPRQPLVLERLKTEITSAKLLRDGREVEVTKVGEWDPLSNAEGPALVLPQENLDPLDTVVVVELAGPPEVDNAIRPAADGSITLGASLAEIHGSTARYESDKDCIGYWVNLQDWVSWEFVAPKAGKYAVEITYATEKGCGGGEWEIRLGEGRLPGQCKETGAWTTFSTEPVEGTLEVKQGKNALSVIPASIAYVAVMNLQSIVLRPR